MPRRATRNITSIQGTGQVSYTDVFRVFECGRPGCAQFHKIVEDEVIRAGDTFVLQCSVCGFENTSELILRAPRWKYCRVCEWLQPLDAFHRHSRMKSGHQLECRFCKNTKINPRLNPLRLPEQHREAADRRRLYGLFASETKVDLARIIKLFGGTCFNCGRALETHEVRLDHTLPARFLWPLRKGPTLLCADCNAAKAEKWPSEFYRSDAKLRALARLTGIPYETLAGEPLLNQEAVLLILENVDSFIERWIHKPEEIKRVRRMVLRQTRIDIYERATTVPGFLLD